MSSLIGWKRSLWPASPEVAALFMTTPASGGALTRSLSTCLQSAALCGAGFGVGGAWTSVRMVVIPAGVADDSGPAVVAGGVGDGDCPLPQAANPKAPRARP